LNKERIKRIALTMLFVVGIAAGTAVTLGSKLLAFSLFVLGIAVGLVGHFGKRKRAECAGAVLLLLSMAAVFLPFDVSVEYGSAWKLGMQSDFETVSKDGRTYERYKYDIIPIGTKTRWRIVLYIPHEQN
jgi:hypothetical protein